MHVSDAPSVMRYLGRRQLRGSYPDEIISDYRRRLKLLRVHGLIKKVAKENRYMLTAKGRKFACALTTASAMDIKGLTKIAA